MAKTNWQYGETVQPADMNGIGQEINDLTSRQVATSGGLQGGGDLSANRTLSIADNGVTDTKIGNRTIDDTVTAVSGADTPTRLWSKLANMIKATTGEATWWTLPGMTIKAIKAILDAATNIATASTLVKRDGSGRFKAAAPSAADDVVRKAEVDVLFPLDGSKPITGDLKLTKPTNRELVLYYDATGDRVVLSSVHQGVTYKPIVLNGSALRHNPDGVNEYNIITAAGAEFAPNAVIRLTAPNGVNQYKYLRSDNGGLEVLSSDFAVVLMRLDNVGVLTLRGKEVVHSGGGQTINGILTLGESNNTANSWSQLLGFNYRDASGAQRISYLQTGNFGNPLWHMNGSIYDLINSGGGQQINGALGVAKIQTDPNDPGLSIINTNGAINNGGTINFVRRSAGDTVVGRIRSQHFDGISFDTRTVTDAFRILDNGTARVNGNEVIHNGGGQTINGTLTATQLVATGQMYPGLTSGSIASNASGVGNLEVRSATASDAAFLTFHRQGSYAMHFGMDTDNKLKVGGWSAGSNSFAIWDERSLRNTSGNLELNNGGTWIPMWSQNNAPASHGVSGYQKLPNGLIFQWGQAVVPINGVVGVSYPVAVTFTYNLQVTQLPDTSSFVSAANAQATGFNIEASSTGSGDLTVWWFAITK